MAHRNKKLAAALFAQAPVQLKPIPFELTMSFDRADHKGRTYTIPQAVEEIKKIANSGQVAAAKNALKHVKSCISLTLENPFRKQAIIEIDYKPLKEVEEWLNSQASVSEEEIKRVEQEKYIKIYENHVSATQKNRELILFNSISQIQAFENLQPELVLTIYQRLLSDYPRDLELNRAEEKFNTSDESPYSPSQISSMPHSVFWWLKQNIYRLKQICFPDEKEAPHLPHVMPSISATLLKEMIDHVYPFYIKQIQEGHLGLPLDKRKKHEYLTAFSLQLSIRSHDEGYKNQGHIKQYKEAFHQTHLDYFHPDELLCASNAAVKKFHSKQCSEGDGFTLCYNNAKAYASNQASIFYQNNRTYMLDVIEVYCTLVNYALKKSPRNQISNLAGTYYDLAAGLLNEYLAPIQGTSYTYSPVESRIIEFFYYTKAKLTYHGACCVESYLCASSNYYPTNPFAALNEYKRFVGAHTPKYDDWVRETKVSLALPSQKRPKHIMPVRYGLPYTPISYEQQKINFSELKSSNADFFERARNENLKKLAEIFAPSSTLSSHPFAQLENIIKKTCAWSDDFIAIHLLQQMIELASLCYTRDIKGLKQFKQRFVIVEEKKENKEIKTILAERKEVPPKKTHPHPSVDMMHIKAINEKEKSERQIALNSAAVETKIPKAITEKKSSKKNKKSKPSARKKVSDAIAKPPISSPIPSDAKETKMSISGNNPAPSTEIEFKITDAISPKDFFKGILREDSYKKLMYLFKDAPITIQNDRIVSAISYIGGGVFRALTQRLKTKKPLAFKLNDIDLHFMQSDFSGGIASALSHHDFVYSSSFKNVFTRYTCSNYLDDKGEIVPCELTIVPDIARKSPNSIPFSQIKAVIEIETGKLYFIDVTSSILRDIQNSHFRVEIPSLELSAPHENYFLMRFSNYYYKLVVLSGWTADENTTQRILQQDFLSPYLIKIKRTSEAFFHQEISRLIIYHQKIAFDLTAKAEGDKLLRAVLYPAIFAFFSVLLKTGPGFGTEPTLTCVPVLTELFLNYLKTTALPERASRQSHTEWLSQTLTSFKDITKPKGLTFDINAILDKCCTQIVIPPTTPEHAVATTGMFGTFLSLSSTSSNALTSSHSTSLTPTFTEQKRR